MADSRFNRKPNGCGLDLHVSHMGHLLGKPSSRDPIALLVADELDGDVCNALKNMHVLHGIGDDKNKGKTGQGEHQGGSLT